MKQAINIPPINPRMPPMPESENHLQENLNRRVTVQQRTSATAATMIMQHRVLEQHDGPFEPHHYFQSGDGQNSGDQQIPRGSREEYGPMIGRRAAARTGRERVDAGRDGERGRAERVVEQDHPARQKPQVRIEHPGDPGVGGARALIPTIQSLVGDCDARAWESGRSEIGTGPP
jgi:hypothetical protein